LAAALALFNERGEDNVSLAQIAGRIGISEGNLWYHFRSKRDLIASLFAELEERIEQNLSRRPAEGGDDQLAAFADYARQGFRDMWDYRFLYRDRFDPATESALAERLVALTSRGLAEMVQRKLLRATHTEISELTANAWIISRYWLDYLQERHGLARISEADIQAGVKQLFALYRPHLTEAARAQIAASEKALPRKKAARG
jgi:AcrR family transcriptional regulator